ncbi:MAG: hypothetical protein JWO08_3443, partial [Verrucomicrobiaceae bacterium]|nr:hypothetical protein [Verrucomicrobiaceae bacterium]
LFCSIEYIALSISQGGKYGVPLANVTLSVWQYTFLLNVR